MTEVRSTFCCAGDTSSSAVKSSVAQFRRSCRRGVAVRLPAQGSWIQAESRAQCAAGQKYTRRHRQHSPGCRSGAKVSGRAERRTGGEAAPNPAGVSQRISILGSSTLNPPHRARPSSLSLTGGSERPL